MDSEDRDSGDEGGNSPGSDNPSNSGDEDNDSQPSDRTGDYDMAETEPKELPDGILDTFIDRAKDIMDHP
jgi:hypothetical protein